MTTGEVSADTDDLGWFVEQGERYVGSLLGILETVASKQTATVLAIGRSGPPPLALTAFEELADEATITNGFVDTVRRVLLSFSPTPSPMVSLNSATLDWALDQSGLRGTLTGNDLSGSADRILASRISRGGKSRAIAEIGAVFGEVVERIDEGDDLGISNDELNQVADRLKALNGGELVQVVANLSDRQLDRLFHNVHSSGFWSNDWDDRERTEFYDTLSHLSPEQKQRLGAFSPYLEALALAEEATSGNPSAARAFSRFSETPGFRESLSFDERSALLWQTANYPSSEPIRNLGRLSEHDWFHDFDVADTERSAKMIAFLSQFETGDEVVIGNTLDLFLEPGAPYRFDWDQDGTAYGSAGGDAFHFNRAYLDAGDDPVGSSSNSQHMVTHTVAHEVNHLVNGDDVAESFEYFMGEYRAYYVGHIAQYGTAPTRADVEPRVRYLVTADTGAYRRIGAALGDETQGPLIAAFVAGIVGRPVTPESVAAELSAGVTDPTFLAPMPISVDGGPNILDNAKPGGPQ